MQSLETSQLDQRARHETYISSIKITQGAGEAPNRWPSLASSKLCCQSWEQR